MPMQAPPLIDTTGDLGYERLLEKHASDWQRWFEQGVAAGDLACDLPRCDGDAWEHVAKLLRNALREPWSRDERRWAEDVVTALATLAADREASAWAT